MGFFRQEYWSGLPFSPPGDLPDPGIEPAFPALLLLLSRFSRVRLCATSETAAHQAPLSLGFSRQEDWSGLPFSSPGDIHDQGTETLSLHFRWSSALQVDSLLQSQEGSSISNTQQTS